MKKIRMFLQLSLILVINFVIPFSVKAQEASLVGSPLSLQIQNEIADKEGLIRIKDDETLEELKRKNILVKLPGSVKIDRRLNEKWQWTLPHTATFIEELGIEFINKFGRMIQVNSAVRTEVRQLEIVKEGNLNAFLPLFGPRRPPHLTGATVDIAKMDMNKDELEWTRKKLLEFEIKKIVEATEEHLQAVFHVMVFKDYLGKNQVTTTQP
jgi:hypothetical protein